MIYFRHQITRFVILFQDRSGSSYLIEALDSHPDVHAVGEALVTLKSVGPQAQLEWTRQYLAGPLVGRRRAIGFKTKLHDVLDPAGFADLLRAMEVKVIVLNRHNRIKMAVSWFNLRRLHARTGGYNLYDTHDRLPPFSLDLAEFKQRLTNFEADRQRLNDFVQQLGLPNRAFFYEDLYMNETLTLRQMLAFLQVRDVPLKGKALKNTSDDLRDVLTNFHELRAQYVGTVYEPMFDEVLIS